MADTEKPVVAVYVRYYLTPSETFIYRQLQGVRRGFRPIVLTSHPTHLDLFPTEPIYVQGKRFLGKVYTRLLNLATGRFASLTPKQKRYWTEVLTAQRVQLIHAHFGLFAFDVLPLAKSLGIPMVVTFHGTDASAYLKNKKYLRELPRLVDYAHVITVSRNMAERMATAGIEIPRVNVHYIGVPVDEFGYVRRTPIGEKLRKQLPVKFLQVANFVEKKGHKYTVEAFARVADKYPNTELVFAGDGPLRQSVESRCADCGLDGRVTFMGKVAGREVASLMREADLFVHHSVTAANGDSEGIPTVLMEAMSTGLPVMSTRHSGIPELVSDGVDGFLVGERDVDAYAAGMESLVDADPQMGGRARSKIEEKFNMSLQNDKLMDIYRSAIE
jgi:glycosyltransferase involved in cell wall biosynthesis